MSRRRIVRVRITHPQQLEIDGILIAAAATIEPVRDEEVNMYLELMERLARRVLAAERDEHVEHAV
jgi:hypothetical protein